MEKGKTKMKKLIVFIAVVALTSPAWANYSSVIKADAPLSFWEFEDATSDSGAVCADSVGVTNGIYKNSSTSLPGISLVAGPAGCGKAAQFNGDSDGGKGNFIDILDNGYSGNKLTQTTMSIELLMKTTASASNYPTLISHGTDSAPLLSFGNFQGPPVQTFQPFVTAANNTWYAWPPGILGDGNWHQYVVTFSYDGEVTAEAIYIDSVRQGTHYVEDVITPNSEIWADMILGANGNQFYTYNSYVGALDEVSIFGRALTQAQITAHYNALVPALVPEPATIALLSLGSLFLFKKRGK